VAKGEELGVIESQKAVVGFHSPVSGTVLEANQALAHAPGLVNQEPYEGGWICRVSVSDLAELSQLMTAAQYQQFCGKAD